MYDKYLENKSLFNTVSLILISVNRNDEVRVTLQLKLFEYLCIKPSLRPEFPLWTVLFTTFLKHENVKKKKKKKKKKRRRRKKKKKKKKKKRRNTNFKKQILE